MRLRPLAAGTILLVTFGAFVIAGCGGSGGGGKTATPAGGTSTPGTSQAGTPIAGQVPPEAQAATDAVVQEVLRRFIEVPRSDVTIVSVTAKQWADSCLEVVYADQTEACAQVVVPGWEIVVHFGDTTATWHTNDDGSLLRFATEDIATSTTPTP